jgi:hypothetical protein
VDFSTVSPPDKGEKEPQEDNFLQVRSSSVHDMKFVKAADKPAHMLLARASATRDQAPMAGVAEQAVVSGCR